jgi:hypothetical protein
VLSQCAQHASQREAEINGPHPGVAGLGQVIEGLEGVVEVAHCLAPQGMVR